MPQVGLDGQFALQLAASLNGVSAQLQRREEFLQDLAESIAYPETHSISFTGAQATPATGGPAVPQMWGPTLGYTWFVQLVTVGPLASGDTLALYRGLTLNDNQPQRLKNQWSGANGTWQVWHPGRTGLRLSGGKEGVIFDPGSGTLTSATRYYVNIDAIQVADRKVAQFLL